MYDPEKCDKKINKLKDVMHNLFQHNKSAYPSLYMGETSGILSDVASMRWFGWAY